MATDCGAGRSRGAGASSAAAVATIAEAVGKARGLSGRKLFDALVPLVDRPDIAIDLLDAAMADIVAHPQRGVAVPVHAGQGVASLRLYRDRHVALSLMLYDRRPATNDRVAGARPASLSFTGGWTRLRVVGGGPARGVRYRLEPARNGELRCREWRRDWLVPGRSLTIANAGQALRFDSIDRDMAILKLVVRDPRCEVARIFDAVTGRRIGQRQAREEEGRMRMVMTLLRSLGRRDAVLAIAEAMADSSEYLRWEAMRECLALDARQAMPGLVAMARQDPSPELRALAARTNHWLAANHPGLAPLPADAG